MKRNILTTLALALLCAVAYPATVTVNPGQSISTGISQAAAGDTVLVKPGNYTGFTLNKAVIVRSEVREGAVLSGGVTIESNNCTIDGFRVKGGILAKGVFSGGGTGFSNVNVLNNHLGPAGTHVGVKGSNWLVEGNNCNRLLVPEGSTDDANYMTMFGTGHVVRRNWFHGTLFGAGPEAISISEGHVDGIQYYGNNGMVLRDCIIEQNFFTDFFQGAFLTDQQNNDSIRNVTIRDNVFWGTLMPSGPGFNGKSNRGISIGGKTPLLSTNSRSERNLIYRTLGNTFRSVGGHVGKNIRFDSPYTNFAGTPTQEAEFTQNPQFRDINNPLGPDGVPWFFGATNDDGWVPTNPEAAGFGPSIGAPPPPPPPANQPPVANPDTATVAFGSQFNAINVLANDTDPDGDPRTLSNAGNTDKGGTVAIQSGQVVYTPAPTFSGVERFSYTVSDGRGGTAQGQVTVTVSAPPPPPDPEPTPEPGDHTHPELEAELESLIDRVGVIEAKPAPLTAQQIQTMIDTSIANAPRVTEQRVKELIGATNLTPP